MLRTRFLIAAIAASLAVLASCSFISQGPSATQRAERLNAAKSQARALIDAHRYEDALELLTPLSREASGDSQLFVMLGETYQGLERVDDAIMSFESAISLNYRDSHPHMKLASLLTAQGKTGRALTEFELAARYGRNDAVNSYNYGLALYEMGYKQRALEQWQAAWEQEPDNPRYAESVGIGLTETRPAEAVGYFEKAAALGANDARFFNNFGLALRGAGDAGGAAERFRDAVAADGAIEVYRFNLAAVYTSTGECGEAIPVWDQLIERFGSQWNYVVHRGRAYVECERYSEAIESLEPLVSPAAPGAPGPDADRADREPPLGDALELLAVSHNGLKNVPRALEYITRAVELDPENVSYLNNYGIILVRSDRIKEALAQWRRVLEIDPNNAAARKNLSMFEP